MAVVSTLCLALRSALFIFTSAKAGRRTGTTVQNRESRGGKTLPDGAFFFCPSRNLSFPWNCMVWQEVKGENVHGTEGPGLSVQGNCRAAGEGGGSSAHVLACLLRTSPTQAFRVALVCL